MEHRPSDAHEALAKFLMSETPNTPAPDQPDQPAPVRPKLIIPGAEPAAATPSEKETSVTAPESEVRAQTSPQPITPPQDSPPTVHSQAKQLKIPVAETPETPEAPPQPVTLTVPTPDSEEAPRVPAAPILNVPVSSERQAATSAPEPQTTGQVTVPLQGVTSPIPASSTNVPPAPIPFGGPGEALPPQEVSAAAGVVLPPAKKGLSTPVKAVIGVALAVVLGIATVLLISGMEEKNRVERLNRLTAPFKEAPGELPSVEASKKDISILLRELITPSQKAEGERPAYLTALWKADASDGTDIDAVISEFATTQSMNPGVRLKLFEVLARRKGDSAIPALVAFAGRTDEPDEGKAAMEAAGKMANTENFGEILKVVSLAENSAVKSQAVSVLSQVVSESDDPSDFTDIIITAYQSAVDTDTKTRLIRLLGASGGDTAAAIVTEEIAKGDVEATLSAIAAMRQWPDTSMFDTLHGVADGQEDNLLRSQAFTALVDFLRDTKGIEDEDTELYWTDVANIAVSETEQMKVVDGMARQKSEWAGDILDYFINDAESNATDRVIKRSEQAKRALENRIRRLNKEKK